MRVRRYSQTYFSVIQCKVFSKPGAPFDNRNLKSADNIDGKPQTFYSSNKNLHDYDLYTFFFETWNYLENAQLLQTEIAFNLSSVIFATNADGSSHKHETKHAKYGGVVVT